MKKGALLVFKVAVSIGLIVFLLNSVGWEDIWSKVSEIDSMLLAVAAFIVALQFPISASKWRLSLRQHELEYSYSYLQTVQCIGYFLNNFLPTGIGGDAYRFIRTVPKDGAKSGALSAILLERIVGLLSLLIMAFVAALIVWQEKDVALLNTLMPIGLGLAAVALPGVFIAYRIGLIKKLEQLPKVGEKLAPLTENLRLINRPNMTMFGFIALSFAFQITAIVIMYVLFEAAGYSVSLLECAVICAFGGIVVMLPISIAGIGVLEGATVSAAVALGHPAEPAIIAALSLRFLTIPASVTCGLIFLTSNLRNEPMFEAQS